MQIPALLLVPKSAAILFESALDQQQNYYICYVVLAQLVAGVVRALTWAESVADDDLRCGATVRTSATLSTRRTVSSIY